MPGFVDGHTHLAQQLLRGGVVDEPPIIWQRILIPFETVSLMRISTMARYWVVFKWQKLELLVLPTLEPVKWKVSFMLRSRLV